MTSTAPFRPITADDLLSFLQHPPCGLEPLVLDTRPSTAFASLHLEKAVSISIPKILLKRIQKGSGSSLKLDDLVVCEKEQLARRGTGCTVVLYDDTGALEDIITSTILTVLASEGIIAYYVSGGFSAIRAQIPELCVSAAPTRLQPLSIPIPEPSPAAFGMERLLSNMPLESDASEILPYLVMSNEKQAQDVQFIRDWRITHVLNLTLAPCHPEVAAIAKCHCIPLKDHTNQDISEIIPEAIKFIEEARDTGGRVLVHCFAGVSRSASVTIAYMMKAYNMTLDDAYHAVQSKRTWISPNLNFMGQLQKFGESLRGKKSSPSTPAVSTSSVLHLVTASANS